MIDDKETILTNNFHRKMGLDYIKQTLDEWTIKEFPPNKENNYIRELSFTRNEEWKFEE